MPYQGQVRPGMPLCHRCGEFAWYVVRTPTGSTFFCGEHVPDKLERDSGLAFLNNALPVEED